MKVDFALAVDGYKTTANLTPDPYDAVPPVQSLVFHTRLRIFDPSVAAVTSALVLEELASESITISEPVQAHVAEAIDEFVDDRKFRVEPVEYKPLAQPAGTRTVRISVGGPIASGNASEPGFLLGDSHLPGSFSSVNMIGLSSNISHFFDHDHAGALCSAIAGVVFVAPDYAIGEVLVSEEDRSVIGDARFERYRALLKSINIKLTSRG